MAKVPVILDTDIGDDIDDTWALAYLLSDPSCDLRLVVTAFGDRERHLVRARIVQRLLTVAGLAHIPVVLGVTTWGQRPSPTDCGQQAWCEENTAAAVPAHVAVPDEDGVAAMAKIIKESSSPVTLLSIGPMGNVASLLDRFGDGIAARARLVGMQGSVRRGYSGGEPPSPEHNVACDAKACARALAAPWLTPPLLAPLDTCLFVKLAAPELRRLAACKTSALPRAVLEATRAWLQSSKAAARFYKDLDLEKETTVLFDTLASYLALHGHDDRLLVLEDLWLQVDEDGYTIAVAEEAAAPKVTCALDWRETGLASFTEHLASVLLGEGIPRPSHRG